LYELKNAQGLAVDFLSWRWQLQRRRLLKSRRVKATSLNVEEYPKSTGAYNNLGDAYAKNAQKEQAIASYRKSLELDPNNQGAADKLKDLDSK
jgi:Tfp pilus assembly protein PilF